MILFEHPIWQYVLPYAHLSAGRDNLDLLGLPDQLRELALGVQTNCVACGAVIAPLRARVKSERSRIGNTETERRLFYAPTCPTENNPGCSRTRVAQRHKDAMRAELAKSEEAEPTTNGNGKGALLCPFFSYFGGKWTLAKHYPPPEHDVIVEPFAGSAGYATRYHEREVILVEKNPLLAEMWRWLIGVSADEVMSLPLDASLRGELPSPARSLIGFWCARGRTRPATTTASRWMTSGRWPTSFWGEYARERIAAQVGKIRHWRLIEGDYSEAPDVEATWFIDPPYVGSRHYLARVGDYDQLGAWCQRRRGLVIVCEAGNASWLPFEPFREAKNIARGTIAEVVYAQRDGERCACR